MNRMILLIALMIMAACDPQELADKALRRTAETVVQPVVARDMPAGVADLATACILDAANQEEINGLARDAAVEAGSRTKDSIRIIAQRPAAAACFARSGVPPLRG